MSEFSSVDPVAVLREIEDACRGSASGSQRKADTGAEWSGVAYRVGADHLVSQLGEVIEILEYPQISKVPLARSWVRGIANVRGNLLPVIDLGDFLHSEPTVLTQSSRVLVVGAGDMYTGLLVDEVMGLRHFLDEEYAGSDPDAASTLEPYLQNGFVRDGRVWSIFSLYALAQSPAFLKAAV